MLFTKLTSQILNTIRQGTSSSAVSSCWSTSLLQQTGKSIESIAGGPWGLISVRTNIRCYFPRPCEVKRAKHQGYKARMATPGGRAILMRRILKGRHVLSH